MYLRYGDLSWEVDGTEIGIAQAATRRPEALGNRTLPAVELNGVSLHSITEAGCIDHILSELDNARGGVVVPPNLDHLRRCKKKVSFSALVAEADLVVADGMPLVWASRLQKTPLPERVAGSDLISSLSARAAERGRSIYMLGGAPGTAHAAAKVLQQRHPNLHVAGVCCPPFGFEKDDAHVQRIAEDLAAAQPDIIFVALGSPKQELLIERIRRYCPNAWWLGVGNSFSFLSGDVRRAPLWMQKRGLEWAHRLLQEPRRLFKRYLVFGIPFALKLFAGATVKRLTKQAEPTASQIQTPALERVIAPPPPRLDASPIRSVSSADGSLSRLRAVVLLGGSIRPTPFKARIGRSVLDLPLRQDLTLLNHWAEQATRLSNALELDALPVRVMVDRNSPDPVSAILAQNNRVRIERDFAEYRGTGGVLADLAADYAEDDVILVANAAQLLLEDLDALAGALAQAGGAVSLVAHHDGTPSGVMLLSCKTLRHLPRSGFIDMKEQALPLIAQDHEVTVVHRRRPTGMPIRSLDEYITALRIHHRSRDGRSPVVDSLSEDWRPTFAIVEDGAIVDPAARLHDSVILRGAKIEAAVVVRSLICGQTLIRRDRTIVDQIQTPDSEQSVSSVKEKCA